jgi:putative oxidoreductase
MPSAFIKNLEPMLDLWAPRLLSILRIVVAFLFFQHGSQKLFGFPSIAEPPGPELAPLWLLAGVLETFGGLAVLLGLFTRPVAFILSGEMAVAYFLVHARENVWPILNGGDLAVFYCFMFLYLAAAGGGAWSLDRLWRGDNKAAGGVLSAWEPQLLGILRIVAAFLFLVHGTEEIFGIPWPPDEEPFAGADLSSRTGIAHLIETVFGPLLLLGLFTRPVAFLLSGEMAFAYFLSHAPRDFWTVINRGEDAVFFCFVFLYFVARGGGPWSLDHVWRRARQERLQKGFAY